MSKKYFVSGATGLIGSRVLRRLVISGSSCVGIARSLSAAPIELAHHLVACDLTDQEKLSPLLGGVDVIIHCAGYAHAFGASKEDLHAMSWETNYLGTKNLLSAASQSGIKKFIFLSSTKAMGEVTNSQQDESSPCNPTSEYGKSKLAAESAIQEWGDKLGIEVVILRLTMVFGAGLGNLERMARLIKRGAFPSLPKTGNHRSLLHIDDAVDAVITAIHLNPLSNSIYIVSGNWAPSGRELYEQICYALGKQPASWMTPQIFLRVGARLCDGVQICLKKPLPFNSDVLNRILKSAWYSSAKLQHESNWRPIHSCPEGIQRMVSEEHL